MNTKFIFSILITLFFSTLFLISISSLVSATSEDCYLVCLDNFADDVAQSCYDNFHYDELSNYCIEEHAEDYGDSCLETYHFTSFDSGEDCVKEHPFNYYTPCVEDNEDELKDYCFNNNMDEMRDDCINDHFSEIESVDGCCPENSVWDDDLDGCVSNVMSDCKDDGRCPMDDDWYTGECDGYLGSNFNNPSDFCISEDEADCLQSDGAWTGFACWEDVEAYNCIDNNGYYSNNKCYDTQEEMDCFNDNLVWSYEDEVCYNSEEEKACLKYGYWNEDLATCYSSEEELDCALEGGYISGDICFESEDALFCNDDGHFWSYDLEICFNSEDKKDCAEIDGYWNDDEDECFDSKELSDCYVDSGFYCYDLESCVDEESMCCEEEDLYVDFDGVCADSSDEAACLNDGTFWSDLEDECFDSEDKRDCVDDFGFWSDLEDECFDSEEKLNCLEDGFDWFRDVCFIQDDSDSDNENYVDYSVLELNTDKHNDPQHINSQREGEEGIKYASPLGFFQYLYPVTLTHVPKSIYPPQDLIRFTPGKFNPSGDFFIFGNYDFNSQDQSIRFVEYTILSSFKEDSSVGRYSNFNLIQDKMFRNNFGLLLDWNYADNSIYFLNQDSSDSNGRFNFTINKFSNNYFQNIQYDRGNSRSIFDVGDLDVFSSSNFILENSNSFANRYDLFSDYTLFQNSNLFELNPLDSTQAIVGINTVSSRGDSSSDLLMADLSDSSISYSQRGKVFSDNIQLASDLKLGDTNFFKYSNNGKYILHYDSYTNRFYIYTKEDFLSNTSDFPVAILKDIIPHADLDSYFLTSFSFDSVYQKDSSIPKGIFYSVSSFDSNIVTLYYLDIVHNNYFELYSFESSQQAIVDSIEINPVKNELMYHYCKSVHNFDIMYSENQFTDCYLDYLVFERSPVLDPINYSNLTKREKFLFDWNDHSLLMIEVQSGLFNSEYYHINLTQGNVFAGKGDTYDARLILSNSSLLSLVESNSRDLTEPFIDLVMSDTIRYLPVRGFSVHFLEPVVDFFQRLF